METRRRRRRRKKSRSRKERREKFALVLNALFLFLCSISLINVWLLDDYSPLLFRRFFFVSFPGYPEINSWTLAARLDNGLPLFRQIRNESHLLLLLTSIMWLMVIIYSLIYSSRREWEATVTAVDAKGIYTHTDILSLTSSSDRKQNKMKVVFSCLLCRRFHHGIIDTFKWYANRLVDIFDQSTRNTRKDLACVCSSNWSNTLITERERGHRCQTAAAQ